MVAQRGLFQTPRVTLCVAEISVCGLGTKKPSEVFSLLFPIAIAVVGTNTEHVYLLLVSGVVVAALDTRNF